MLAADPVPKSSRWICLRSTISLEPARQVADTFVYKLGDTNILYLQAVQPISLYPGDAGPRIHDNRNRCRHWRTGLSFSSKAEFGTQTNTLQHAGYQ